MPRGPEGFTTVIGWVAYFVLWDLLSDGTYVCPDPSHDYHVLSNTVKMCCCYVLVYV